MARRRIPAPLGARILRGLSVALVLSMAAGTAPFAPQAPATAGPFGTLLLHGLLGALALAALVRDIPARWLALAIAAAGSCHILQAQVWGIAALSAPPADGLLPVGGAILSLGALLGLGIGAATWEERRGRPARPAPRTGPHIPPGPAQAPQSSPGAIRPRRIAAQTAPSTPRPQRVKPVTARKPAPGRDGLAVHVVHPVLHRLHPPAARPVPHPDDPPGPLLLTPAMRSTPASPILHALPAPHRRAPRHMAQG